MATSLTVYPNKVSASAVLSTANQLIGNATVNSTGGTTTNLVGNVPVHPSGYGEITSQGTGTAWLAGAVDTNIAPTGKGWFLDASTLDSQDVVAGNWTAAWKGKLSGTATATVDLYTRFYVYNAGVYTQIGVITQTGTSWSGSAANYTSAATSMPAASFPAGSHLYIDLWADIQTNGMISNSTIGVNQSTIAGDGQATCNTITPGYAPTSVALTAQGDGVGTLAGTLSLSTALTVTEASVGTLTAGTPQLTTALSGTLSGTGTVTGQLAIIAWHASGTLVGSGQLSGALALSTSLGTSLTGVGTLTGTPSLSTALTASMLGAGMLTGTLSTTSGVALSATLTGAGTLAGGAQLSTALSVTLSGVGALVGTPAFHVSLAPATCSGVGTLAGALTIKVALSGTMAGAGTLAGTLSQGIRLSSATLAGNATLSGTLHQKALALKVRLAGVGTFTGATALTLYPNKTTPSATLSSANQLIGNATLSGTGATTTNLVGLATGFGEITSQGTTNPWAAGAVNLLVPPTGLGWFLDANTLDMTSIVNGNWQAKWRGKLSNGTATVDLYTRIYSYLVVGGVGVYTQIGVITQLSSAWTNVVQTFTSTAQALPLANFPAGSKLYIDLWATIQPSGLALGTGDTIGINQSSIAGDGESACNITTPGYAPWSPPVTLPFYDTPYGFSSPPGVAQCHFDAALALGMSGMRIIQDWTAVDTSGAFPSDPSTWNWTQTDSDVAICTQNGFNYTFVLSNVPTWGQWTPPGSACTSGTRIRPDYALFVIQSVLARYNGGQVPGAVIARFEPVNEGFDDHGFGDPCDTFEDLVLILQQVYPWVKAYYPGVLVGTAAHFNREHDDITSVQTSLYTGQYGSAKGLFDYSNYHWYGTVNITGSHYDGPDGPQGGTPAKDTFNQEWQDVHAVDVFYGNGSVPVYCTETGMNLNPPNQESEKAQYWTTVLTDGLNSGGILTHIFAWTLQNSNGYSLTAGCGTPTYLQSFYAFQAISLAYPQWPDMALYATFAGLGQLTASPMNAVTHLTATLAGAGTLAPTLSARTALGCTMAGVGQLAGTMAATTALVATVSSTGILSGTMAARTALTSSMPGVGTLSGAMAATTSLAGQLSGVGTLSAGVPQLATALGASLVGAGALSGTTSLVTTLSSVTLASTGTFAGTLVITAVWLTGEFDGVGGCDARPGYVFMLSLTLSGVGDLSGILSIPFEAQLAGEADGVGTIAGALSLSTALSGALSSTGVLTGALSANLALSGALASVGALTPGATFTLATALSSTLAGVGALIPAVSLSTALSGTTASVGTLGAGTFQFATALTGTLSGVGGMSATTTLGTALTGQFDGVGMLTGTISMQTALTGTLASVGTLTCADAQVSTALTGMLSGTGQLSGVPMWAASLFCALSGLGDMEAMLTLAGALSVTFAMGVGTLAGAISFPGPSLYATWVTRDLRATWVTRDLEDTWKTGGS